MEKQLKEQVKRIKPLITGISDDAGSLARFELRYIQKVIAEGVEGIPRLALAVLIAVVLAALGLITFVIGLAYLVSEAGVPLWAGFGIVTLLLIASAGTAVYLARNWIGPQLNVVYRLKEHWSRCFSSYQKTSYEKTGERQGPGGANDFTGQESYRHEVH